MVFVTGGTGFWGAYIIKALVEKGYQVRALRRSASIPFFIPSSVIEQVEWVEGDVLDIPGLEESMEGADAVIHSAAKVSFVADEVAGMFQTNIEGTANMVNLAISKDIKRFIHVSSVAALGRTTDGDLIDENKQWEENKNNTQYAISKYRAEMEVWRAIGEGLEAAIVNPATIIGFGDWDHSSCTIFKSVYEEFPWYTNGINGFVDVEDVAKATVLLMESKIKGERFVLNGDNWSFRHLFDAIADEFDKKHPAREATPFLAGVAWRIEKLKSLFSHKPSLLTKESAKIALAYTRFDNQKIQQFLPAFTFTPLEQTISQACTLYKQHNKLL